MTQILKAHVALNTPHFEESVRFYRAFLGLEPVKLKPGYAKFDVAEPPLNLTLNASTTTCLGALNHLGIQVASTEAVEEAKRRVEATAGSTAHCVTSCGPSSCGCTAGSASRLPRSRRGRTWLRSRTCARAGKRWKRSGGDSCGISPRRSSRTRSPSSRRRAGSTATP